MRMRRGRRALGVLGTLVIGVAAASGQTAPTAGKIPITTTSAEARSLYQQGRDLLEKLRATDGRKLFEQAIAKDKDFALAYLGLANTAGTTKEFIDATTHAATLASRVSEGERHLVLGLQAGLKGEPASQERHYTELVRLFPNDERAHNLLGTMYFGRQDYATAVKHYLRATEIDPSFSPPYNQLGYAYRFLEKFPEAEQAFKKYIELIPRDPNPYDSYAELLMKLGRFDESIANYEKALGIDANFVPSYVGIGNNQMFLNQPDRARATFAKLAGVARNTGERRQARFWTAASHVHDGASDKAIAEIRKGSELARADKDLASVSGDLVLIGDILREAGRLDEAAASYAEAVKTMAQAQVPEEVKQATRRNQIFEESRLAVARGDLTTAKARAGEYARDVAVKRVPFELRQQHELAGLIAMAEKNYKVAVDELKRANQQDPRVVYLTAVALQGAGDSRQAQALAKKAAQFNGLNFTYGYVRSKAQRLAGS
jgi:tetratricopeptide (TPR) repeat protein